MKESDDCFWRDNDFVGRKCSLLRYHRYFCTEPEEQCSDISLSMHPVLHFWPLLRTITLYCNLRSHFLLSVCSNRRFSAETADSLAPVQRTSRLPTTLFQRHPLSFGRFPRIYNTGVTPVSWLCSTPQKKKCRPHHSVVSEWCSALSMSIAIHQPTRARQDHDAAMPSVSVVRRQ